MKTIKKEARFVKTWKNKLLSVVLMICGVLTTLIEGDATVLLFISLLAIPMFFTKEIWVKWRVQTRTLFFPREIYNHLYERRWFSIILFVILMCMLVIITTVIILAVSAAGASGIIVCADVIVCVFIIIWIMKLLKRRKDGRRWQRLVSLREMNNCLYEHKTFGGFNYEDIIEGYCLHGWRIIATNSFHYRFGDCINLRYNER